jgi:short-subunit dehydrogenase
LRGIIVTGASSGLGAALALAYASPGVKIGLVGRDATRLASIAAACRAAGAETDFLAHDIADAVALGDWLLAFDRDAPVDLVIAGAGISGGPAPGTRSEGVAPATRQVATNLLGVVNTVEPLLPALLARGRGGIAIIASAAGLRGLPYSPAYSASKAGVRAYGEALRALVAPAGVKVSVVCPGFFSSPMTERWHGPTPFLMTLDRAASIVKHGVDRGRARITFPWLLALGLRLADLIPPALGDAILRDFRFHISER